MPKYILIIVFSVLGLSPVYGADCNPLACYYLLNNVFENEGSYEKDTNACTKIIKVNECIESCISPIVDEGNIFIMGMKNLKDGVCKSELKINFDTLWKNKCIKDLKFQLIYCIYEAWDLEYNDTSGDSKLINCRRILESQSCPAKVFNLCDDNTKEIVETMVVTYFDKLLRQTCSYSLGDIWDLKVRRHSVEIHEYETLSKCFDSHHHEILSCVPNKWTTNFIMSRNYKIELCVAFETFVGCISKVIVQDCDDKVMNAFKYVAKSAYKVLLPYCVDSSPSVTTINHISEKIRGPTEYVIEPSVAKNNNATVVLNTTIILKTQKFEQNNNAACKYIPIGIILFSMLFCVVLQNTL